MLKKQKILKLMLIMICALLTFTTNVKAAGATGTFSLASSKQKLTKVGDEFTISVIVNETNKIAGITGTLTYDKNVLELITKSVISGWDSITYNNGTGVFNTATTDAPVASGEVITFGFKVIAIPENGQTTIQVNPYDISYESLEEVAYPETSITVQVEEEKPAEEQKPGDENPGEEQNPGDENPGEEQKPGEENPGEEQKPGEENPGEEQKPGEEKPSEEQKPSEEKPSEEQKPANTTDNKVTNSKDKTQAPGKIPQAGIFGQILAISLMASVVIGGTIAFIRFKKLNIK